VIFNEFRSDGIWPSDVQIRELLIHVIPILNLIDNSLSHHESKRMVLSHGQKSIVSKHVRGSAHQELIILEVQPGVDVMSESHFGVHVNSSVVPEGHPSPKVNFEGLWSHHFEGVISAVNS